MPTPEDDPAARQTRQDEVSRLLIGVLRRLRRGQHEQVTRGQGLAFQVYGPYLAVLRPIAERPGVTVNELARMVGFPKSRVSVLMSRLAADGVICKDCDEHDGRLVRLSLTPVGRERVAEWRTAYRASLRDLLGALSDAELAQVADALALLYRALSARGDTGDTCGHLGADAAC